MKTFLQFITENTATQQATRLGLEGDGHGGWYKDGEFVAKTEKGRLKFYNKRQKVGGKDPEQSEKEKNLSSPNTHKHHLKINNSNNNRQHQNKKHNKKLKVQI